MEDKIRCLFNDTSFVIIDDSRNFVLVLTPENNNTTLIISEAEDVENITNPSDGSLTLWYIGTFDIKAGQFKIIADGFGNTEYFKNLIMNCEEYINKWLMFQKI